MTTAEVFGYRLALALGAPHPDYLLDTLTWEQWRGWEQFYDADPWGEVRKDLRAITTVIHTLGCEGEATMTWPYFAHADEEIARHKALEARKQALLNDPAEMAKINARLAAGKTKFLAEKAKRGG